MRLKHVLRSIDVAGQLLFSMFLSTLTFDVALYLGYLLLFGALMVFFLGSMWGSKTVFGSTHVVEQHLFSMIPLNLIFEFDLILGSFLSFSGPNGLVWGGSSRVQQLIWGLLM